MTAPNPEPLRQPWSLITAGPVAVRAADPLVLGGDEHCWLRGATPDGRVFVRQGYFRDTYRDYCIAPDGETLADVPSGGQPGWSEPGGPTELLLPHDAARADRFDGTRTDLDDAIGGPVDAGLMQLSGPVEDFLLLMQGAKRLDDVEQDEIVHLLSGEPAAYDRPSQIDGAIHDAIRAHIRLTDGVFVVSRRTVVIYRLDPAELMPEAAQLSAVHRDALRHRCGWVDRLQVVDLRRPRLPVVTTLHPPDRPFHPENLLLVGAPAAEGGAVLHVAHTGRLHSVNRVERLRVTLLEAP